MDYFNQVASVEWSRISKLLFDQGLLAEMDRAVLEIYCVAYSRWIEAEKKLKTDGLTIETTNGNVTAHPLVGIANQAMDLMQKILIEFGMATHER